MSYWLLKNTGGGIKREWELIDGYGIKKCNTQNCPMAVIYDKKLFQLLSIKSLNNKIPLGTDAYIVFMYE